MKAKEKWRPVPSYKGLYEVSDQGRVRSLDRIDSAGRSLKGKMLKPVVIPKGYLKVTLCKNGVRKDARVHRLVLIAFAGAAPKGHQCCHWNDVKADNVLLNLRWGAPADNKVDARRNGISNAGEASSGAKLCAVDVQLIRDLAPTIPRRQIADWFGVAASTIYRVINRETWVSC